VTYSCPVEGSGRFIQCRPRYNKKPPENVKKQTAMKRSGYFLILFTSLCKSFFNHSKILFPISLPTCWLKRALLNSRACHTFLQTFLFFISFGIFFSCSIPPKMTKTIRHIAKARFANTNGFRNCQTFITS